MRKYGRRGGGNRGRSHTTKRLATNGDSSGGDVSLHLDGITNFPKLVVFDLDNTCWTPELYQIKRKIENRRGSLKPIAGKDVKLFDGFQTLLNIIKDGTVFPPSTKFAVASRTQSVEWAYDLLHQFNLYDIIEYVEIYPKNKKEHFTKLAQATGISYEDMLFFDDARDGKYGNCVPVSELGVLSVHCPNGIYENNIWKTAFEIYDNTWNKQVNTIIEYDGSITYGGGKTGSSVRNGGQEIGVTGTIKMINYDKGFGFLNRGNGGNDVFFHFNDLPNDAVAQTIESGDTLRFDVVKDTRNGKLRASNIELTNVNGNDSNNGSSDDAGDTITMRAFSMNLPFAALLANGHKTIESRNGTMFTPYKSGTQMLLHVGQRIYPDGDKHLEIMEEQGLSSSEITKLKSLPTKFNKGMIVAILEIGETYDTTVEERSTVEMQRSICAYGADSGRRLTEIKRVSYLKKPIPMKPTGGVFKVQLPKDVLPDDWELDSSSTTNMETTKYRVDSTTSTTTSTTTKNNSNSNKSRNNRGGGGGGGNNNRVGKTSETKDKKGPMYSISG